MKVCSICRHRHEDSAACVESHAVPPREIPDTPEDLVPGFRLTELINTGQTEQLHRGREASTGRSCLIRIIEADQKISDDIIRDSKTAARLFHPSIAGLFDAGLLDDGRCFVVSEDLDGKTLREVLDNVGCPDLLDSIEIVRETAEALHALHAAGLIHGAVNPRNIVLSKGANGAAKVQIQNPDLGRAKQGAIISNRFLIDSELDALRYFSPEQCTGGDPSVQCDVYGLGVVFYEMLAGTPPFDAPTAVGLIHQQQNVAPPEIKIQNFNLRMLVTHALTEALQKPVRLRQSSANVFARQLRHIEQLATHTSTPPPAGSVPKPVPVKREAVFTPAPPPAPIERIPVIAKKVELPAKVDEVVRPVPVRVTPRGVKTAAESAAQDTPKGVTLTKAVTPTAPPSKTESTTTTDRPQPIFVTPRSRLKLWKKKWRTIASRIATETESQMSSILESGRKRMASEASISSIVEPPARPKRRKIEWETPDDDIPTVADVREAVSPPVSGGADGVVPLADIVIPTVESMRPNAPAVSGTPRPVVAPLVEKSTDEVSIPATIVAKTEPEVQIQNQHAAEASVKRPKRQPDKKQMPAAKPVAKAEPTEIAPPARPAIRKTTPTIQAPPKIKDSPSAPGLSVPRVDVAAVTPNRQPQEPAKQRSGLGFKVNLADLEEITLVRPPSKRIKIDWERMVPAGDTSTPPRQRQASAPREVVFSPTILGSHAERKTNTAPVLDEMFSVNADAGIASATLKRAALIGAGVVTLLALMLFSNAVITSFFQTSSAADATTAQTVTSQEHAAAEPIAAALVAPTLKIAKKERPVAKDRVESQAEPAALKTAAVALKPAVVASKTKAASSVAEKPKASKSKPEVKVQTEKKPVASRDKITRPRIVRDPKH